MLSIVTDPLQSSISKHQIMIILSNNYHAILISFFTASVVILTIYWTSKYYQQTADIIDPKTTNDETKTKTNIIQPQKQNPSNASPSIQPSCAKHISHHPISIQKPHHEHKQPQFVPSPNPKPIQGNKGIPDEMNFFSHNKAGPRNNYKSFNNQADKPPIFTPFETQNNNGFSTIRRRKVIETSISIPNQEPITIKKTITEHIDIPSTIWSPFSQGLRYAVAEDQGLREHMENSTSIIPIRNNHDNENGKTYSFSVFDGHLGDEAAKFCTTNLHKYVERIIDDSDDEDIVACIRKAFHCADDDFKQYAFNNQCEAGAVGVYAYYQCNAAHDDSDCIYVANVGDCRAILCSKGKLSILTEDHNPKNEEEKKRCGILIGSNSDLLCGQISVTRAIGDYHKVEEGDANVYKHAKLDGLICDPHIIKHKLHKDDEFLILACDGLWDVMDSQNAMTECRRSLRRDGDVQKAAQKLVKLAKLKTGQSNLQSPLSNCDADPLTTDNISVMVIGFATKEGNIGPKQERLLRSGSRLRLRRKK